jgi:hypothetical protein
VTYLSPSPNLRLIGFGSAYFNGLTSTDLLVTLRPTTPSYLDRYSYSDSIIDFRILVSKKAEHHDSKRASINLF